jgi:hypothetical protein
MHPSLLPNRKSGIFSVTKIQAYFFRATVRTTRFNNIDNTWIYNRSTTTYSVLQNMKDCNLEWNWSEKRKEITDYVLFSQSKNEC